MTFLELIATGIDVSVHVVRLDWEDDKPKREEIRFNFRKDTSERDSLHYHKSISLDEIKLFKGTMEDLENMICFDAMTALCYTPIKIPSDT